MEELMWNESSLQCYENKFYCKSCGLKEFCDSSYYKNEYRIKNMKYVVLKLFSLYGQKGLNDYKRKN